MTQDHPGVFGGVDTHKHTHVAAVLDGAGRVLGSAAFDADTAGYTALLGWLGGHGSVERVGVEGTGSYGAGLARHLAAAGVDVVDVNRPNRQMRRRRGKTDTVDAEAAARAALNGCAAVVPKSADGCVEAIRTLRVARRSAVKARTVAANQIDAVVVTAPEPVKDRLRALNTARTVEACARMRPDTDGDLVRAAAKRALRSLARRHQALTAEIKHLDAELRRLCERANPALLGACGVGAETAAALLVAAGDNPERLRSEASFAALCGTSPIEASSGRTVRHRLNRGGNRQANNALWRIAMVRLRVDERSIAYAARLTAEGKTRREILRCLKRHIAREVYKLIIDPPDVAHGADLRRHRTQRGLTIHQTARALGAAPNRISELERGIIHNRDLAERYQRHLAQTGS
ncbi:IS110 family transposase [Candidatus Poriferisodalis sp.]|uniref:IS110 family transposase n=1 Tax=Candidatus Poriferisodalis sp. TaxID=3101277 RepID=UPI003B52DD40